MLSDLVVGNGWLCYYSDLSDNFTVVGTVGGMYFKKVWKINGLKIWHYYCCYICTNNLKIGESKSIFQRGGER